MFDELFISFVLAFIVSFSSTPIARKLAFHLGAVDVPKDDRRMHQRPIARLGGLAIVAGFFVSLGFAVAGKGIDAGAMGLHRFLIFFVLGLLIIAMTGIVDDAKNIRAVYKLMLQIVAASLVVFAGDIRVISVTNPFSETGISDLNIIVSYLVSICWIIGITNAINLIDGLDGLAAGVSAISCASLLVVSLMQQDYITAMLTCILAGSAIGFLPYNFNPAKIFMGDTGSMFLGFTLSVISIQGTLKSFAAISFVLPMIVLGLPLFDTTFTIFRRMLQGKPIMQPDRGHLHHRLVDMGLTQKQSVLVLYTASAVLGLSAIVLADKGPVMALFMFICVMIFVIAGAKYLSEFTEEQLNHGAPLAQAQEKVFRLDEEMRMPLQQTGVQAEVIEKVQVVEKELIYK